MVIWYQSLRYLVRCVSERHRVRITVLRKFRPGEVFTSEQVKGSPVDACSLFTQGQEFTVDESGRMPEGFCAWAWDDLYKVVTTLRFGGDFSWFEDLGVSVNCCTDGLRPVIFKLERI